MKADIVFLYDDSSSISSNNPANFNIMKTFMKNVVGKFSSFGSNGMQFSAACFSDKVTPHFNLKKYSTEAGLLQGITDDVIPSNGGATHIGSGLKVKKTLISKLVHASYTCRKWIEGTENVDIKFSAHDPFLE